MKIPKISVKSNHQLWCESFMREQNKTTTLVRRFVRKTRLFNPFSGRTMDNMLQRYEKSFWG